MMVSIYHMTLISFLFVIAFLVLKKAKVCHIRDVVMSVIT